MILGRSGIGTTTIRDSAWDTGVDLGWSLGREMPVSAVSRALREPDALPLAFWDLKADDRIRATLGLASCLVLRPSILAG